MAESLEVGKDGAALAQQDEAVILMGDAGIRVPESELASAVGPHNMAGLAIFAAMDINDLAAIIHRLKLEADGLRRNAVQFPGIITVAERLEQEVKIPLERLLANNGGQHLLDEMNEHFSHEEVLSHYRWQPDRH